MYLGSNGRISLEHERNKNREEENDRLVVLQDGDEAKHALKTVVALQRTQRDGKT
jgi:hypothetical protein